MSSPLLIAEVKTCSPFGYRSDRNWNELFEIADEIGDWVSVHTHPAWGGSFELLRQARRMTSKPLLAKGLHTTDAEVEQAFSIGADHVLTVGRYPSSDCLCEPHTLNQLLKLHPKKAVWNQRDLKSGRSKQESFDAARNTFRGWLCQASLLRSWDDVHPRADAILVGEHLEAFVS